MKTPSFKTTPEAAKLIGKIVDRAVRHAESAGIVYRRIDASMDITACHCNGCPLRLSELLEADDFNFNHDVFGIRASIDRTTGQMPIDGFSPRFSAPEPQP